MLANGADQIRHALCFVRSTHHTLAVFHIPKACHFASARRILTLRSVNCRFLFALAHGSVWGDTHLSMKRNQPRYMYMPNTSKQHKTEFVLNANDSKAERTGSDAEAALTATAALLSATLP
eukprot:15190-Heterococcus_DN1.PRE.1